MKLVFIGQILAVFLESIIFTPHFELFVYKCNSPIVAFKLFTVMWIEESLAGDMKFLSGC